MNRCGHWPQFEDAEQFNRLHIEFLRTGGDSQMTQTDQTRRARRPDPRGLRRHADPPIRTQLADLDVDAAYAIQQEEHGSLAGGGTTPGRKQDRADVAAPCRSSWRRSARLRRPVRRHDGRRESEPSPPVRVLQPKIEAEVAFLLDRDVDVEVPTVADVLRAVCLCDAGARNRRQPDHQLGHRHRRHRRRQRLVGTLRPRRSSPPPRRLGPARPADADDEARERSSRRERALRASAIPSTRWRGSPANWAAATARCAPATSCSQVPSVPWCRSRPETGSWRRSAK